MLGRIVCIILGLVCHAALAVAACPSGNLLRGTTASSAVPILHPERLTDGEISLDGTPWDSNTAALVTGAQPLVFDLGHRTQVRGMVLQGDNAGGYRVSGSLDGRHWTEVWRTGAAAGYGLRLHLSGSLAGDVRWIRIEPPRPESAYAISEIGAFCDGREASLGALTVQVGHFDRSLLVDGNPIFLRLVEHRLLVAVLGLFALSAAILQRRLPPRPVMIAGGAVASVALLYLLYEAARQPYWLEGVVLGVGVIMAGAPALALIAFDWRRADATAMTARSGDLSALAALIAGVGAVLYASAIALMYRTQSLQTGLLLLAATAAMVAGLSWASRPDRPTRMLQGALLCLTVASAYACVNFGNSGQSTFVAGSGRAVPARNTALPPALVAFHDQYHYYMGAKYFSELGYDRLYLCTAVSEEENGRGAIIRQLKARDLSTNQLVGGEDLLRDADRCRGRFSASRWAQFRSDADYFRTRQIWLGASYMLIDHGYNASPFWTFVSEPLVAHTAASDSTLERLAWIDIALLAGMYALLWRAFGLGTAALAALLWGTGSIWVYGGMGNMGSFGRNYWVFGAVAGVCLLRRGRFALGGSALSVAVLDRMFPAALLFGPLVLAGVDALRGRTGSRLVRMLLGSALVGAVLGIASVTGTGGAGAVRGFLENSVKHTSTPLTNYIGLRTLFSTTADSMRPSIPNDEWKQLRRRTFEQRRAAYWTCAALLLVATGWVCWKIREPWKVTVAGLLPMFVLFDLTNYYYVVLVLLAPLAMERPDRLLVLLGASLAGQFVFLHGWETGIFPVYSCLVLAVLLYFLAAMLRDARMASPPAYGKPDTEATLTGIAGSA